MQLSHVMVVPWLCYGLSPMEAFQRQSIFKQAVLQQPHFKYCFFVFIIIIIIIEYMFAAVLYVLLAALLHAILYLHLAIISVFDRDSAH